MLTADHGFMPAPDHSKSLGRDAGKQSGSETIARLNAGLSQKFGEAKWALGISALGVRLDKRLLEQKNIDRADFDEQARTLLLAEPGIQVVYTSREIESGSRQGAPFFDAVRKTWDRERSADLQFALKPYWMMSSSTSVTTHGSLHPYDTNVPILFYGPRWVTPGRRDARVEVADIAPSIAQLLRVPAPSASEGRPLPLRQ